MVNTTSRLRQVSILKIPQIALLPILLAWLGGCQAPVPKTPVNPPTTPASTGRGEKQPVTFLGPEKKPLPVVNPAPTPPPPPPVPVMTRVNVPTTPGENTPTPAPVASRRNVESVDLKGDLPNWRIAPVSNREWRVTPAGRQSLSDSPPSLMEDAIITSGIHARLQTIPTLRGSIWKYSCNSGRVLLSSPELTCNQALAALRSIIALDKVVEIRLTTTLR